MTQKIIMTAVQDGDAAGGDNPAKHEDEIIALKQERRDLKMQLFNKDEKIHSLSKKYLDCEFSMECANAILKKIILQAQQSKKEEAKDDDSESNDDVVASVINMLMTEEERDDSKGSKKKLNLPPQMVDYDLIETVIFANINSNSNDAKADEHAAKIQELESKLELVQNEFNDYKEKETDDKLKEVIDSNKELESRVAALQKENVTLKELKKDLKLELYYKDQQKHHMDTKLIDIGTHLKKTNNIVKELLTQRKKDKEKSPSNSSGDRAAEDLTSAIEMLDIIDPRQKLDYDFIDKVVKTEMEELKGQLQSIQMEFNDYKARETDEKVKLLSDNNDELQLKVAALEKEKESLTKNKKDLKLKLYHMESSKHLATRKQLDTEGSLEEANSIFKTLLFQKKKEKEGTEEEENDQNGEDDISTALEMLTVEEDPRKQKRKMPVDYQLIQQILCENNDDETKDTKENAVSYQEVEELKSQLESLQTEFNSYKEKETSEIVKDLESKVALLEKENEDIKQIKKDLKLEIYHLESSKHLNVKKVLDLEYDVENANNILRTLVMERKKENEEEKEQPNYVAGEDDDEEEEDLLSALDMLTTVKHDKNKKKNTLVDYYLIKKVLLETKKNKNKGGNMSNREIEELKSKLESVQLEFNKYKEKETNEIILELNNSNCELGAKLASTLKEIEDLKEQRKDAKLQQYYRDQQIHHAATKETELVKQIEDLKEERKDLKLKIYHLESSHHREVKKQTELEEGKEEGKTEGKSYISDLFIHSARVLEAILDASFDACIVTDKRGIIVRVNEAALHQFGYVGLSDLLGQHASKVIKGPLAANHLNTTSKVPRGVDWMKKVVGKRSDGIEFDVNVGIKLIETESLEKLFVLHCHDLRS